MLTNEQILKKKLELISKISNYSVVKIEKKGKIGNLDRILEFNIIEDICNKGMTCEGCQDNDKCEFAFDPYNMKGDCLALK